MPLTGHLWPKLDCCTTSFPIWGPILDITGFLVKCGLIWLNMGINAAWFDWQLAIYTTPLTFRDWKQCHEKYFYFVKRAIPIGNFVGYHPSIILYFWSCGGTYPPGWTVLFIHEVIWLCHSMDIWDQNWTVVKSLFWYQDQILYVYCWVRVPMRLNFYMGITAAWFDWTLAIYPTPLIFRNSK